MSNGSQAEASQARVRPYLPPLNQHFRKKSRYRRPSLRRKILAVTWDWMLGPEASSEHYSQEPLEIQQITSVRYRTHRMETTQVPRYHSVRLLTGHSGSGPKKIGGPAPSLLFVWVT